MLGPKAEFSKRGISRRGFALTLSLPAAIARVSIWAPRAQAQTEIDADVILRAMRDELARSRQLRVVGGGGDDLPYFISYTLSDETDVSAAATLGALTSSTRSHYRAPSVEVRVGGYDFDNTGHVFSGAYSGSRFDTEPWPLDDNYKNLREALWLATDHAYKAAVESIARKRASLSSVAAQSDLLPDFSKGEAITSIGKASLAKIDQDGWSARAVKLSAVFSPYPDIVASGIDAHINQGTKYIVNSEGTAERFEDNLVWMIARAEAQAADGMYIRDGEAVQAFDLKQFPSDAELQRIFTGLAERVKARVHAPPGTEIGDSYIGPVLFEPIAAAQLFGQLLGDNLRIPRKPISDPNRPANILPSEFEGRVNARVLPDWLDVTDDPTQTMFNGKPLLGYYPFDLEGMRPKAVNVIQKGILKSFLTTRQPVKNSTGSNGHARLPGRNGTRIATISNLFVNASRSEPLANLKTQLLEMCKLREKPYGMLVRRLDYPFTATGNELQTLMAAASGRAVSPPVLIYRVYPDGREELVRGLRFRAMNTRSLRDILSASAETAQFDFMNNGAPLAILGIGGMIAPASVIAPGVLFDELELERPQEQLQRPPVVPPPNI